MEAADGELQGHGTKFISPVDVGRRSGDQFHAHAVRIRKGQDLFSQAVERPLAGNVVAGEALYPEAHRVFGNGEGRLGDLARTAAAFGRGWPGKEREDGAGMAGSIAIIQVVGCGIVKVDRKSAG